MGLDHDSAVTTPSDHQPGRLELAVGPGHGAAGKPKVVGELADGGKSSARREGAGAHQGGHLLAYLLIGRHRRPSVDLEDHVATGSPRRRTSQG